MHDFRYRALDRGGRERQGHVRAASGDAARARLEGRGLYVLGLDTAFTRGPALFSRKSRLSGHRLTLFTRQLATLAEVAPLEEALRTIARQGDPGGMIGQVHQALLEGESLGDAMAREPRSFPPLYRAMIAAGEVAGTLPDMLSRLALMLERQSAMRARVLAALAYPAALALVALLVVAGLMAFVVPRVVAQFTEMGQALPLVTRIVIALSAFLADWWWALLLGLAAVGAGGAVLLREPARRRAFDAWLLTVPFAGRLLRDLGAARLARTLATMVGGRVPLVEGLLLTAPTIRNHALRHAVRRMAEEIRGGGAIAAALASAAIFPPLLVYMAASGEASGRLDLMLARAADYLEREFDMLCGTALALLEPAIIVLMGLVVGTIVLAILLPILQLNSLATGL